MIHSFNTDAAEKFGLLPAVLLNHIGYWVLHNKANDTNFYDGDYWTYNSKRAFAELFPYATQKQITYALDKLKDAGAIKVGNYNKSAYDRTLWYTLTDFGMSFVQISSAHWTNLANGETENVEPIPNNNTNIKPPNNNTDTIESIVTMYNSICDTLPKCSRITASRKKHINARLKNFTVEQFEMVFAKAMDSDFLSGRKGGWRANIDWFIKSDENFTKVLEGKYDNFNRYDDDDADEWDFGSM